MEQEESEGDRERVQKRNHCKKEASMGLNAAE